MWILNRICWYSGTCQPWRLSSLSWIGVRVRYRGFRGLSAAPCIVSAIPSSDYWYSRWGAIELMKCQWDIDQSGVPTRDISTRLFLDTAHFHFCRNVWSPNSRPLETRWDRGAPESTVSTKRSFSFSFSLTEAFWWGKLTRRAKAILHVASPVNEDRGEMHPLSTSSSNVTLNISHEIPE